jgi:hypothetical protein
VLGDWPTQLFCPESAMKSELRSPLQNRCDSDAGIGEVVPWWRLMEITRMNSAVRTVYVLRYV